MRLREMTERVRAAQADADRARPLLDALAARRMARQRLGHARDALLAAERELQRAETWVRAVENAAENAAVRPNKGGQG